MSTVANPRRTGGPAAPQPTVPQPTVPQPTVPEPTTPAAPALQMIAPTGVVCDGDTCALPGTDAADADPRP